MLVEPPGCLQMLEVTECEPGEKGNTATGATKPCTVETGAVVYVPLFVNLGDKLKIDTRRQENTYPEYGFCSFRNIFMRFRDYAIS